MPPQRCLLYHTLRKLSILFLKNLSFFHLHTALSRQSAYTPDTPAEHDASAGNAEEKSENCRTDGRAIEETAAMTERAKPERSTETKAHKQQKCGDQPDYGPAAFAAEQQLKRKKKQRKDRAQNGKDCSALQKAHEELP